MSIHHKIVSTLRERLADDNSEMHTHFVGFSDEQLFHKIFHNYRGTDMPKGLRLTWLGYSMIKTYFKEHPVDVPEGYRLGFLDLLYLDNRAKMPYYIGRGENDDGGTMLVVFESKLGILLKLADGMISNLRDMES